MPNSQTNLRLDAAIKAAAIKASSDNQLPLARWIEKAILAYLGSSDGAAAGADSVSGAAEIASLVARVEAIEARLDDGAGAAAAGNDSSYGAGGGAGGGAQLGTHGYTIGEALIQAGARITHAQALGRNRNRAMMAAHGMSAQAFLEAAGWQLRGKKWFPSVPSV